MSTPAPPTGMPPTTAHAASRAAKAAISATSVAGERREAGGLEVVGVSVMAMLGSFCWT